MLIVQGLSVVPVDFRTLLGIADQYKVQCEPKKTAICTIGGYLAALLKYRMMYFLRLLITLEGKGEQNAKLTLICWIPSLWWSRRFECRSDSWPGCGTSGGARYRTQSWHKQQSEIELKLFMNIFILNHHWQITQVGQSSLKDWNIIITRLISSISILFFFEKNNTNFHRLINYNPFFKKKIFLKFSSPKNYIINNCFSWWQCPNNALFSTKKVSSPTNGIKVTHKWS